MISAAAVGIDIGSSLVGGLVNDITGSATNAARTTREQWTLQMAQQGSALAAALIVAAPSNVSGNEATGWRALVSQIPAQVLAAANQLYPGGYWPVGQPDFYTDTTGATHTTIVAQVAAAHASTGAQPAISSGATSTTGLVTGTGVGAVVLPTVTTTAPRTTSSSSTWLYVAIGVVVLTLVAALVVHRRRR